jgi:ammonia channel protein AmtB
MTAWIRTVLSMALGVLMWISVSWAIKHPPTTISFSTEFWMSFSKIVGSNLQLMFLSLAPWCIVGITADRTPILAGAAAAAIAWILTCYPEPDWVTSEYSSAYLVHSVSLALIKAAYGAAGAALGAVLVSANNSFKPRPLRGSA